ncbi:ORF6N domain-containing protein, partial [Clostridium perfringens]
GIKNIDGMKFHDIEGGFGEGKKAMLVKEIANIHNKDLRVINQNIERNRERFKDNIDIVDLKGTDFAITLSDSGIYTQNSINASKNIYLLSERGYSKLLKIL